MVSTLYTVVFVPISRDTGLDRVHPTWAGTYILDACVYLFPTTNFALIDSDCVPVTLFEIQELWLSCDDHAHSADRCMQSDQMPTSPIAPAHKRARSVDTGKATQQPGPPSKLSKSRSVENLSSTPYGHHFFALQTIWWRRWIMVAQMDKALVHLDKRIPLVAILLRLHNQAPPQPSWR